MDLLGSILGSMEKPPSMGDAEKKRVKEQKALLEKQQEADKKRLHHFKEKIQKRIHDFIKDASLQKTKIEPMDKVYRAIVHEVADIAGLTSFSFGIEEQDRYVMLWKKALLECRHKYCFLEDTSFSDIEVPLFNQEFAPSDEELSAYRKGEEWDPEKAKEIAKQKELQRIEDEKEGRNKQKTVVPASNYKDKYKHLIGESAAKDAAKDLTANRAYGFVPSENKRDQRTIEQVLADTRAKKKLKTEHLGVTDNSQTSHAENASGSVDSQSDLPSQSS